MPLKPLWIGEDAPPDSFPDAESALREPNGLLAVGGSLDESRLLCAYRRGIFPWFSEGQPVLWWSPDPRAVLFPERLRVSRSLRRTLRDGRFEITTDQAFREVMLACAGPRRGQDDTWIVPRMVEAYCGLHAQGFARSVECWVGGRLVGGLYGVALGAVFFGESMFSRESDASKVALHALCGAGYRLIDCQLPTSHLASMGAELVLRQEFLRLLERHCDGPAPVAGRLETVRRSAG